MLKPKKAEEIAGESYGKTEDKVNENNNDINIENTEKSTDTQENEENKEADA